MGLALNGDVSWAICTKPGGPMTALFDTKVPVSSNCTSLANVLLSIWHAGNLHNARYDASQASGGDDDAKVLGRRYGYTALRGSPKRPLGVSTRAGLYTTVEEIQADTKPGTLYHFAFCDKSGFITHDTLLLDGEIYECTYTKSPACHRSDLVERWTQARSIGKYAIVYGPA